MCSALFVSVGLTALYAGEGAGGRVGGMETKTENGSVRPISTL
jgi:hypothetical protein